MSEFCKTVGLAEYFSAAAAEAQIRRRSASRIFFRRRRLTGKKSGDGGYGGGLGVCLFLHSLTSLVALFCTRSISSIIFFLYGDQTEPPYSSWLLIRLLYSIKNVHLSRPILLKVFLIIPSILYALFILLVCVL